MSWLLNVNRSWQWSVTRRSCLKLQTHFKGPLPFLPLLPPPQCPLRTGTSNSTSGRICSSQCSRNNGSVNTSGGTAEVLLQARVGMDNENQTDSGRGIPIPPPRAPGDAPTRLAIARLYSIPIPPGDRTNLKRVRYGESAHLRNERSHYCAPILRLVFFFVEKLRVPAVAVNYDT